MLESINEKDLARAIPSEAIEPVEQQQQQQPTAIIGSAGGNASEEVDVSSLILDKDLQARVEINQEIVDEYASVLRERGWIFDLIQLVSQFVTDGWHRVLAVKQVLADPRVSPEAKAKLRKIPALRLKVDPATDDIRMVALRAALGANHDHGLRRSNKDKRRAAELAVDAFPDWSTRQIAELAGVSHALVGDVRRSKTETDSPDGQKLEKFSNSPGDEHLPPSDVRTDDEGKFSHTVDDLLTPVPVRMSDTVSETSTTSQEVAEEVSQVGFENVEPAIPELDAPGSRPVLSDHVSLVSSSQELVDRMLRSHVSPLVRGLDAIRNANGGPGPAFKRADQAIEVIIQSLKQMRRGNR